LFQSKHNAGQRFCGWPGREGTASGFARATQTQFVYASGSVVENDGGQSLPFDGEGNASLSYSFEIVDPDVIGAQPVLMFIRANGVATASGEGEGDGFFQLVYTSEISGQAVSVLNLSICNGVGCPDSASPMFTLGAKISLLTNTVYVINLSATGGAANFDAAPFSGSGSALIDPYFALDSSVANPSDYTLFFSPGIINQPIGSGVPEPSTWALLGLGFAAFQVLRLRGRRSLRPV
jgi:PEP-CTERM motif